MPSKIFLIACEPSGDAHGAALVRELRALAPDLEVRGLGGPQMAKAGVTLLQDMTTLSALGLGDVLRLYWQYRKIFYRALEEVRRLRPNAVVVIDSPAFNLRFAKKLHKEFPLIYYISPQIWAWGRRRIHTIRRTVSKMLVILPFEKALYDQAGVPCDFVGHPLLDHLSGPPSREEARQRLGIPPEIPALGLLAGSREKEVQRIFPLMLESAREIQKRIPRAVFWTRFSPNVPETVYESILFRYPDVKVLKTSGSLEELVRALDFALITSGTATLETALLGTPYLLLYKASLSTYLLGRWLVRVPFLGLVNLLAGKSVVPEFIQDAIRPKSIAQEVESYLKQPERVNAMREEFRRVKASLGSFGASRRAALAVLETLREGTR